MYRKIEDCTWESDYIDNNNIFLIFLEFSLSFIFLSETLAKNKYLYK